MTLPQLWDGLDVAHAWVRRCRHWRQLMGYARGWFAKLHYGAGPDGLIASEYKPTIADVHTQPSDENGNEVGRILHVATGTPRLMMVTVDSCQGPRAYAGVVMAYHELIAENWTRLTDAVWTQALTGAPAPADVEWADYVESVVSR